MLALPRGGVPVAYEVARALGAPLDVFVVRKLGVPGYEELAMGAVATGGVRVLNDDIVTGLRIPGYLIEAVTAQEQAEVKRRERAYRGGRPPPDMRGRTVLLVDDGLATGATMRVAVKALRQQQPARIVVAVPVAAAETCTALQADADEVVCGITPAPFHSVGRWYEDFSQTTDEEVRDLLARRERTEDKAAEPAPAAPQPLQTVREHAHPLTGGGSDYDPLFARIGEARFVLLGEASHGTHEFYQERARITRRLIEERGFTAVAVEADWPDAYRVNRYVRGQSDDIDAAEALAGFRRFPTWMWRNTVMVDFVEWLRAHNDSLPTRSRQGRLLRPRPLQPADLDEGGASLISTRSIRRRPAGARALRLLRPFRRGRAGLRLLRRHRPGGILRGGGGQPAGRAAAPGPRLRATRRSPGRGRGVLRRAERAAGAGRRGLLPLDVPRGGVRRGTCATATWPRRWRRWCAISSGRVGGRRSSSGRTTRTSATRGRRRWAGAAS